MMILNISLDFLFDISMSYVVHKFLIFDDHPQKKSASNFRKRLFSTGTRNQFRKKEKKQ